jgi:hypothetical protein
LHTIIPKPVQSLSKLLTGIIDYAGIFPPASLPLSKAWNNYLDYLNSPYSWMLGKFICPAKLLPELGNLIDESKEKQTIDVSVIGSSGEEDFNPVFSFISGHEKRVKVETIEVRALSQVNFKEFLEVLLKKMNKTLPGIKNLFCEVSESFEETVRIMSVISQKQPELCFKVRTGGTETSAFPSSEQIANAIKLCRDNNVKIKCTAGLHHPIRHFNKEVNTKMHGFLNVFTAGVLSHSLDLSEEQLTEILNDEKVDNFMFFEEGFSWKKYNASIEQISEARKNFIVSFGSCSFDEPVNDLKALGLL